MSVRRKNENPIYIGVYYGKQESRVNKEEIEEEMESLTEEILDMSQEGEVILFMDANGKIGLMGEVMSRNGKLLRKVFDECRLIVMNSSEKCKGKVTRQNRKNPNEKSAIDFVVTTGDAESMIEEMIIDEDEKYLMQGKTASDHNSILLSINIKQVDKKKNEKKVKWRVKAPEENWLDFQLGLENMKKFSEILMSNSTRPMNDRYQEWIKKVEETAMRTIGKTTVKMNKSEKFSDAVTQLRKDRKLLKNNFEEEKDKILKNTKKEKYIMKQKEVQEKIKEERAIKMEGRFQKMIAEGNNQGFWKEMKKFKREESAVWMTLKDEEGKRMLDPDKIKERVARYYEGLYTEQDLTKHAYHDEVKTSMTVFEHDMSYEDKDYNAMPRKEEIKKAIMKKKNGKSTTDLPNEIIKGGDEAIIDVLYPVIKAFWEEEKPPLAWNEGLISSLWKGKGDKEKMEFQRGITVSSTIAMVTEEILNERMTDILKMTPSQGGGKKGSSTRDHVFILRSAIHLALRQKLEFYVTFYDVQKAYDHADPEDMMFVAWTHGLKGKLWRLTKQLNTNLTARIKTRHGITRRIIRQVGGKQGGKTMTLLFAKMMDVLAEEVEVDDELGVTIGNINIGSLLWVDDVVTFSEGSAQQHKTLQKTNEFAIKHKMEWGQSKCNVMEIGRHSIKQKEWYLGDKKIISTDNYKYLGDIVSRDGNNKANLDERSDKVKVVTRKVMASGRNEVMKQIQVKTLLQLHEIMTIPALLINCETWILNKTEREKLDRMEIWALKKLLGLPKTTPTAGVIYESGTLFTSIRVDQRQILYLQTLLQCPGNDWGKQVLKYLETENIGWAKQINMKLIEYDLPTSWELIEHKSVRQWKDEVNFAVELKNIEKLTEHCYTKKGEKAKTKSLIGLLKDYSFYREPNANLLKMSKMKVKAVIMGRYGMLDCGKNYENKYKNKHCVACGTVDDELHRINECVRWRNINLYDSRVKIKYESIYSNDPKKLSIMATTILMLWDIENGKNEMKVDL